MCTPTHWKNINFISCVLYPLGLLYGLATFLRLKLKKSHQVGCRVICVGNLGAGGSGKTPVAVSLAKMLQQNGKNPFFITRGYGGQQKDVLVTSAHTAAQVGDEPLLLFRQAPVVVNPDRFRGALKAVRQGADVIIMDDGFQNPSLHKDISLLVIDGSYGFGNGFCIPAGPLREFLSSGLKRADAAVIIGEDKHNLSSLLKPLPVFKGKVVPECGQISNRRIIAFAGIGRPQKFYQSLKECGFELLQCFDFPDHHFYNNQELEKIISAAQKQNADIYTTAKDFVKIPSPLRSYCKVLEISIEWENPQALYDFLLCPVYK